MSALAIDDKGGTFAAGSFTDFENDVNERDLFVTIDPNTGFVTEIARTGARTGDLAFMPVPEPTSTSSLLVLGILGAASTLKRKLKLSQSTEKKTTKVG